MEAKGGWVVAGKNIELLQPGLVLASKCSSNEA